MRLLRKIWIILLLIYPRYTLAQGFWQLTDEFTGGPKTGLTLLNDSILIVSCTNRILRSTNPGKTFEQVLIASSVYTTFTTASGKILAGGKGKIFISENDGISWDSVTINSNYPVKQFAENKAGSLFCITGESNHGDGVFFSEDTGKNWEPRNVGLGNLKGCEKIAIDKNGKVYLTIADENSTGNGGLFISENNGESWKKMTIYVDSFYAPLKVTNTTGLSVSPADSVYLSFYGIASNFLVQLNICKSIDDVTYDNSWEYYQVHKSTSWWLDRPINNIHFSKKGDRYSSYTELVSQGATYYSEAGQNIWQRVDDGLGRSEDGWRKEQVFAETESGRIFMIQYLDERIYTTDKSLVTFVDSPVTPPESIQIFPNPVKKDAVLTIKTSNLNDNLECSLYDLTGRKISMQTIIDNTFELSNQVPSGIYILFIKTKNRIFKEKIVVE